MRKTDNHPTHEPTVDARCPSCRQHATFTYAGEQRWPRAVAQAMGMPEVITLWLCGNCHSTISEPDLREE